MVQTKKTNLWLWHPALPGVFVGAACAVVCFLSLALSMTPRQYDLKAGDVSSVTLTATKDVEDTITTRSRTESAVAAVPRNEQRDSMAMITGLSNLRDIFQTLDRHREEANTVLAPLRAQFTGAEFTEQANRALGEAYISGVKQELPVELDDVTIKALLFSTAAEVQEMRAATEAAMQAELQAGISQNGLEGAVARIVNTLRTQSDSSLLPLCEVLVKHTLQPNITFDQEAYDAAVLAARDAVEPRIYKMGEVIVREGEVVTREQVQVLMDLGLLSESLDAPLYIGLLAMVLLMSTLVLVYLLLFDKDMLYSPKQMLLFSIIILITMGLSMALSRINKFFIPMQLAVLLISMLVKPRLALLCNTVISVLLGAACAGADGLFSLAMVEIVVVSLVGGSMAVFLTRRSAQRSTLILAGVGVGFANLATMLAMGLMTTAKVTTTFVSAAWAMAGGFLSAVLALGLMPLFEYLFGLQTQAKLLELSNPNQQLLRRLMLEAPGTYHHSVLVANLAEAATEKVGGNELLARVGAYYHDVGKLKRPLYFIENQLGEGNPHDQMEPQVSAAIITTHPVDGAAMAQREKLPQAIIDIVRQHHGDGMVGYFYHKAVTALGEENVSAADYSYEGPKPQTREAAIIMLADGCEAGVRSMPDHAHAKIREFVSMISRKALESGQLDDVPLTLRDIRMINETFCSVLQGIYHERIEYPTLESIRSGRQLSPGKAQGAAREEVKR